MSPDHPLESENLIATVIDAAEDIRDPLDGWSKGPPPIPARRSRLKRWSGSLR